MCVEIFDESFEAPVIGSRVLGEDVDVAAARDADDRGVIGAEARPELLRDNSHVGEALAHRSDGTVLGGVVQHDDLCVSALERVEAGEQ